MYRFVEVEFEPEDWPGITGIRVIKNGKVQVLGGVSAAVNMKEWIRVIARAYEGCGFKDSTKQLVKSEVVEEVAVIGEDVLGDLQKMYPEFFI